jgi:hypothetical protein
MIAADPILNPECNVRATIWEHRIQRLNGRGVMPARLQGGFERNQPDSGECVMLRFRAATVRESVPEIPASNAVRAATANEWVMLQFRAATVREPVPEIPASNLVPLASQ